MAETGKRNDPYRSFNFELSIDTIPGVVAFSECSGLTADGDAVDYREGIDTNNVRKLVGLRKFTNITLKRGYTKDAKLWEWYKRILGGEPDRAEVDIILKNEKHEEVIRWRIHAAWINKIEGPSFKASGNEVAIESMELIHEGITLVPPGT